MPKWEFCRIDWKDNHIDSTEFRAAGGILTEQAMRVRQFIVVAETSQGSRVIDQTPEFRNLEERYKGQQDFKLGMSIEEHLKFNWEIDTEHSKLIGRLLDAGWEPMETETFYLVRQSVRPTVFKRQVP